MDISKFNDVTNRLKVFDTEERELRSDIKAHSDYRKMQLSEQEYALHPVVRAVNNLTTSIEKDKTNVNRALVPVAPVEREEQPVEEEVPAIEDDDNRLSEVERNYLEEVLKTKDLNFDEVPLNKLEEYKKKLSGERESLLKVNKKDTPAERNMKDFKAKYVERKIEDEDKAFDKRLTYLDGDLPGYTTQTKRIFYEEGSDPKTIMEDQKLYLIKKLEKRKLVPTHSKKDDIIMKHEERKKQIGEDIDRLRKLKVTDVDDDSDDNMGFGIFDSENDSSDIDDISKEMDRLEREIEVHNKRERVSNLLKRKERAEGNLELAKSLLERNERSLDETMIRNDRNKDAIDSMESKIQDKVDELTKARDDALKLMNSRLFDLARSKDRKALLNANLDERGDTLRELRNKLDKLNEIRNLREDRIRMEDEMKEIDRLRKEIGKHKNRERVAKLLKRKEVVEGNLRLTKLYWKGKKGH